MDKETLYANILSRISDGIYYVDPERKITFWNSAAEQISGYSAEEVLGSYCQNNLLSHIDREGKPICLVGCPLFATLNDAQVRVDQVFLKHKKGHRLAVQVKIFPVIENGEIIGAFEIFRPTSAKMYDDDLVSSLASSAMTDELTNLPNRKYLQNFLEYKFRQHERFGYNFCVMFLDIDNFSKCNNTYGHATGDAVLKNLADLVTASLRKTDLFGRWGGEEFIGVFEINSPDEATIIAEKIRTMIERALTPCTNSDEMVKITVSVGMTLVQAGDTPETITERADALMYKSKQNGKNQCTYDYQ